MAVRDEILKMNPKFQEFNNGFTAKLWETDISHTLVGEQDGPSPMKKGVGISGQTT